MATETAEAQGGRRASQPVQNNSGLFSTIYDNRGAPITLYTGNEGFSLDIVGSENAWIWVDLFTNNTTRSRQFYAAVVGFETRQDGDATVFTRDGDDQGGLVRIRGSAVEPNWLPYVGVSNLQAAIDRAITLGATKVVSDDDAAILIDPAGAGIGIAQIGG